MSDCLWNDIDTYLMAALTADMGASSAYAVHKLAQVAAGESWDHNQVSYPFAFVRGMRRDPATEYWHEGDEALHYDSVYPYLIIFACVGDNLATVRQTVKELERRGRLAIAARPELGELAATDGEIVTRVEIGRSQVELGGINGHDLGQYIGLAGFELTVYAET
jgi:hypothetical protein